MRIWVGLVLENLSLLDNVSLRNCVEYYRRCKKTKMHYRSCIKHRITYVSAGCRICRYEQDKLEREEYNSQITENKKITEYKQSLYKETRSQKQHIDDKCSSCDKTIHFEEWFCYCSLCPDCYLQIPEEEIERMDEEFKKKLITSSH